jgi:ankyrin repeat protein
MVQLLVAEGGADLAAADRWGNTPLTEATRAGAADVAAYLRSDEARQAAVKARQVAEQQRAAAREGTNLASLAELSVGFG